MAVDTEKGLLTPVIKDAGDLSVAGLARKIADIADRTRSNKIGPDELAGGTFTLTNTGSRGALFDTPIINQPQVGILGTGAVVKRAVVVTDPDLGEAIVPRSMVYLALSYDHRLVDGADAARFLGTIKERLEGGAFESELGETIAIRSMCYLALTYDHRLVDGADAARFLTTVKQRLEDGSFESDLGV
jgi:2-oxoglutarate dehydrogenase E2 component (dihydrolipoamide succinyltransferase)